MKAGTPTSTESPPLMRPVTRPETTRASRWAAGALPEIAGEVVQVTATLFQRAAPGSAKTTFIDATDGSTAQAKVAQFHESKRRFRRRLDWFEVFPGRVFTA